MSAMRISTKGRYAVRVMLDLALYGRKEYVKARQIAERQGISEKYLEQIIAVLNRAGFVRSVRGAQGGYCLAGSPEDYTVGQILRLTEGSLSPAPCLEECGEDGGCGRQSFCEAAGVWRQLADAVNGVVDHVTIADLVRRHMENVPDRPEEAGADARKEKREGEGK